MGILIFVSIINIVEYKILYKFSLKGFCIRWTVSVIESEELLRFKVKLQKNRFFALFIVNNSFHMGFLLLVFITNIVEHTILYKVCFKHFLIRLTVFELEGGGGRAVTASLQVNRCLRSTTSHIPLMDFR